MSTHLCNECDSPGDGNCPVCHGIGRLPGDSVSGSIDDLGGGISCSACGGNGECQSCEGSGEIEFGGEG